MINGKKSLFYTVLMAGALMSCGGPKQAPNEDVAKSGNPVFEEARLTLECKVVYKSEIEEAKFLDPSVFPRWYDEKNGNAHIVYIAEIVNAWEK